MKMEREGTEEDADSLGSHVSSMECRSCFGFQMDSDGVLPSQWMEFPWKDSKSRERECREEKAWALSNGAERQSDVALTRLARTTP